MTFTKSGQGYRSPVRRGTSLAPSIEAQRDSVWNATTKMPARRRLERDLATEVCVIGAGVSGLSIAYTLAKAGRPVVVIDDGPIAGGQTSVTTAHIATAIDDRYFRIEKMHGVDTARLVGQSFVAALERIRQIVEDDGIACDLETVDGYLFLSPDGDAAVLEQELEASLRAGIPGVELVARAPVPGLGSGPCLRYREQAQFHPLKYLASLTRSIERHGGQIFTRTHADEIMNGHPVRVRAGRRTVTADCLVVATNAPINDLMAIHSKQAPYTSYVIAATIPHDSVPAGLYWDTGDPYHYVRLQPFQDRHDLIIVGGEDHRSGEPQEAGLRHELLEVWARERFPMLQDVRFRWAGQVMEPADGVAFIGRNPGAPDNVFIVTGDSGQGITHGTLAGMIIPDLIIGRDNPWTETYSPSRKPTGALGEFARDAVHVAAKYGQLVTGGDVSTVDDIPPDSGAVVRRGLAKIAVYRDGQGTLHEFSAVCPHLGCVVHWNADEESWDCPCHGSRFEKLGKVFNGPANTDLKPAKKDA